MNKILFYVTTTTAGLKPAEVKRKLDFIVYNLKMIGVDEAQIFRTDQIDTAISFEEELNVRMREIAKADVIIFDYHPHEWIQGEIELKEASRLGKYIRVNRMSDYEDIRKNLIAK